MEGPKNYREFADDLYRALLENEDCAVMLLIETRNKGLFIGSNIFNASLQFGVLDAAKIVVGSYYQRAIEANINAQEQQQFQIVSTDSKKVN
jgi:hypothetical protein